MSKWVSIWGSAISIAENRPAMYCKDITLRFPIYCSLPASKIRLTFDNGTGVEDVTLSEVTIGKGGEKMDEATVKEVTFNGTKEAYICKGKSIVSDPIDFEIGKQEYLTVNVYMKDYTCLSAGTETIGPLSKKVYALANQTHTGTLDPNNTKETNLVYFLSDIEVLTDDNCKSVICFGDSITAQMWPDYLQLKNIENLAVVRRGSSGARLLRQYECIMYSSYGLKSANRIEKEFDAAGAECVVIQEGINDIIHPVGTEINQFRSWSDYPTLQEMIDGYIHCIEVARRKGLKVYLGTLTPVKGWRTYQDFRDEFRQQVNQWIRSCELVDGVIDFDKALADPEDNKKLLAEYDSGDHLHPSAKGYQKMAETAYQILK